MPMFYNQASINYNNTTAFSNIVEAEMNCAVSMTKTPLQNAYAFGDIVTYAVSITNSSHRAHSNLTLTDDLGRYEFNSMQLYPTTYIPDSAKVFINGEPCDDPEVNDEQPLIISGIDLPSDGNVLIIYSVRVNEYAPLERGASIENTVIVRGNSLASTLSADAEIEAECEPSLSISKSISSNCISENEPVTYTIRIQNNSPAAATASDNVILSDTLNPPLCLSSVMYNGNACREGIHYAYNRSSGIFRTQHGLITVPAATYRRNPVTGAVSITPGVSTLRITGTF